MARYSAQNEGQKDWDAAYNQENIWLDVLLMLL
jgi:hypothetical protein